MPWPQKPAIPWGGARAPWGLKSSGAVANVVEAYTWDASFWGSECDGTNWPEHGGDTAWDLTRTTGVAPTLNQSTSGIQSSGLPSALVDEGVLVTTGSNGFHTDGSNVNWNVVDDFHVRMIVLDGTTAASHFFFRHLAAGTNYVRFSGNSATSLRPETRNTAPYVQTVTPISVTAPGWYLIDWYVNRTAGGGGVTQGRIYINGVPFTPADHSSTQMPSGNGLFGICGDRQGASSPLATTFLFWGVRFDPGSFNASQHNADALSLDLISVGV